MLRKGLGKLFNLALLVLSFALCLVSAEIVIRIVAPQRAEPHPRGFYAPDPELGFITVAHGSGVTVSPEFRVRDSTNSLGLRNREVAPKLPGERRVLILGDSFTYGAGCDMNAAYPQQLEQALRSAANSPEITVINAGIPSYGTRQQAILFERIVDRVDPDVVLLGFFLGNDFFDNLNLNKTKVIDGYLVQETVEGARVRITQLLGIPPELQIALRTKLHLYTLLMNAWATVVTKIGLANTEEMFLVYRENSGPEIENARQLTYEALHRLSIVCRHRKLPLDLVLIPDGRLAGAVSSKPGYRFSRPAEIVRGIASTLKLPVLDLTERFEKSDGMYFPIDGHWNVQGHAVAAREIANALLEGELRPLLSRSARASLPYDDH
jgi:hypothetical protein